MTLVELWEYVNTAGTIGVLLLIIVGGMRRWYVWGWYAGEQRDRIKALEEKLERAERAAVSGTALARRATSLAERAGDPDA